MTDVDIDGQPWRRLHTLVFFDRWVAARTWPLPWTADEASGTVNVVERAISALLTNPATRQGLAGFFTLDPAHPPRDLVGRGANPDVLRPGEAGLTLVIDHAAGRNRLTVEWPGALRPWLERLRERLPGQVSGQDLQLGTIRLDPRSGRGSVSVGWQALPAGIALVADIVLDASEVEVLAPWTLDWHWIKLTIHLFPEVRGERLLWRTDANLTLEPGGPIEAEIAAGVRAAILEGLEAWGPLLAGALMSLPLRPVAESEAFAAIETESVVDLGWRLAEGMYPVPSLPGDLASALIEAALLPTNPARVITARIYDGELQIGVFTARLADHFVRHSARPRILGRREAPTVRFEVEPIRTDAGGLVDWTSAAYGHWAPTAATDDGNRALGRCVVLREQVRLTLDHLTVPERAPMPPVGAWTVEWRARVRHGRLDENRWVTVGSWTTAATVDGRTVTVGPPGVRWAWSEVRGDLSVVGTLRANDAPVCWFDVGTRMLDHGPQGTGDVGSPLGVLPDRAGASPPSGLEREHRAAVVVRAEQQTSLQRSMLEWLTLRVAHVHLTRPGPLNAVGPFAVLFVELRVGGVAAARRRLSAEEGGDVRGLLVTRLGGPTTDVYVRPTIPDAALDVAVVLLGADGDTVTEMASASFTLRRDDPQAPDLRWGVHPGLGLGPVFVRSGEFQVRVDVTDRHFSPDDVAHEDQVREVEVFLQDIDVLGPTEPFGFNLADMHFEATFAATLGNATLAEAGPIEIGGLKTPTGHATEAAPVVLPHPILAVKGADRGVRLPIPPGAELRVLVTGAERAWWLPTQELGTAASTRTYALDEPIDGVAALDPTKEGWAPSAASVPGKYFRFRACAVASPPPEPLFRVDGVPLFGPPPELLLPAGASLDFTYACVPWASALVLERRPQGGDASTWVDLADPTLVVGETAQAALVVPPSGRWRYRLRADSAAGASHSPLLHIRAG